MKASSGLFYARCYMEAPVEGMVVEWGLGSSMTSLVPRDTIRGTPLHRNVMRTCWKNACEVDSVLEGSRAPRF